MQGTYNLWLVAASYLVAVAASFAALELGGRVASTRGHAAGIWLVAGSLTMGLGIWSMHFVGMLAFHLPIPIAYDLWITAASILPAIASCAGVLELVRRGGLQGWRLTIAATLLGMGIATMHYVGMAAIRIAPAIRYETWLFGASIGLAVVVGYIALKLAFSLSTGNVNRAKTLAAALVLGAAVAAMHYTGMGAARFAPGSVCTVPTAVDVGWLAGIVSLNACLLLVSIILLALYDARSLGRHAEMVAALQKANEDLEAFQAEEEEQKRIAKHLMERITSVSRDDERQVESWVTPAQYFSGDLVAVARTPANTLHVLLGDGTGHGLAAALSALPVVQPFCAMTEKGFPITTIAREINNKIRATLPVGRFVAAAIAVIDGHQGVISVWNGGNPLCYLIGPDGEVLKHFKSTHMPLH